ncbi:uncharacterized protein [Rutidosis leptorrhynchoides]|uniref:uncharacterized protein n=1 Tax=Rutidosis leptorrhynchoides TaxID=125765 RepID=UPI003A992F85
MFMKIKHGVFKWVTNKGTHVSYSTHQAWEDLKPNYPIIPWHHVIWFPQANPKHAFIMWLVIKERLTTQDKLKQWYPNKSYSCDLCGTIEDSIRHLFFECNYSKQVWKEVKRYLIWRGLPNNVFSIVDLLAKSTQRNKIWGVINRITLAATVYHIWQERNSRIFKGRKRGEMEIANCIIADIQLKLTTFVVKFSSGIQLALMKWSMELDGNRLKIRN